jgi:neurotransmitter:Na+ symporter, NSS family
MARERWGSRLGIILAVAGSAIGLGNFLRFPGQVAQNGGGAFMIPYFVALLLLGLPLMWIEWTIGRFGGGFGHSTAPGMFHTLWNKNRFIKYFGVIGIFGPIAIFIYYTYVESWLLGYAWFEAAGTLDKCQDLKGFLGAYQGTAASPEFPYGIVRNDYVSFSWIGYGFFIATFAANMAVIYYGIRGGIERVCKWALPILLVLGLVLLMRSLSLGTPDPSQPDNSVEKGLGFMWNPKWGKLLDAHVWLAAAGQIFFTLSVGIGVILTYASYLTKKNDVALSGLTATSANEFAEVILGGGIVIPATVAFFGVAAAGGGTFDLGFITMPAVLQHMAFGRIFGVMWFVLLFLAGITSSISLAQPAVAFMEDEFGLTKRRAVLVLGIITFVLCQGPLLLISHGVLDEVDFWAVNVCLVLFGLIETVLFGWVFGMEGAWQDLWRGTGSFGQRLWRYLVRHNAMDEAWTELHVGADITIPRIYRFVIKYVTPAALIAIFVAWLIQGGLDTVFLRNLWSDRQPSESQLADLPYILGTRLVLLAMFVGLAVLVWRSWRRREEA